MKNKELDLLLKAFLILKDKIGEREALAVMIENFTYHKNKTKKVYVSKVKNCNCSCHREKDSILLWDCGLG